MRSNTSRHRTMRRRGTRSQLPSTHQQSQPSACPRAMMTRREIAVLRQIACPRGRTPLLNSHHPALARQGTFLSDRQQSTCSRRRTPCSDPQPDTASTCAAAAAGRVHDAGGIAGQALSKGTDAHRELLQEYMKRFDFHDQPLDFALRQLFQELHLPAESQQIDRVITGFAEHYNACNSGMFFSADTVYAYAFAILLLHTDAHNPRVRQKMTKLQFIARAKLLDDGDEMFDEILDILYDNVTMVRFEYAPGSVMGRAAMADTQPREQGISGWLRRMFAPAAHTAAPVQSPVPLSPSDMPSKQQYSYSTTPRRMVPPGAVPIPMSPHSEMPAKHHQPRQSFGMASPSSPLTTMSPLSTSANSPPLLSSFTTADIAVPAQPMALETIRVSSLKSHVKRRPSLREGRPLSGIVWPQPTASTPTESLTQLRVDMAGLVSRKMSGRTMAGAR
ncbi:Sec7 domain-containing protein [Kickxella alabastrina]|uniref:Sec7 domain-containing protein n=1 Tax=Kickxella alabastrina TaxID=61397 RepID=UPI002220E567|nr:Sec7 domain-containing protein [Kickxella alabastrina]KAI7826745.1 Sec7 domain-containing protein [Kickxella alabastrina]